MALRTDILDRYNNEEYWEQDVIDAYFPEKGIYDKEQIERIKMLL